MVIRIDKYVNKCKYWFTLAIGLYYAGTIVCLRILHDKTSATGLPKDKRQLHAALTKHKTFLVTLRKNGVLTIDEWDILFTREEETDSGKFDLGLLIVLVQALSLAEPKTGWMNPDLTDNSPSTFLVKLRNLKDTITKLKDVDMLSKDDFETMWDDLCEVLNGFGYDVKDIFEIYQASLRETFYFESKHYAKEYSKAYKRVKILYIQKSLADIKTFYGRHLENLCTVVSVVKHSKIEKVERESLQLKKPISDLENIHDILRHSKYRQAIKFLTDCDKVYNDIIENEKALDSVISRYNQSLDYEEKKITKQQKEEEDKDEKDYKKVKRSRTLKKADVIGWFRRNTLKMPKLSRSQSRSYRNGSFYQETAVVDLGDY